MVDFRLWGFQKDFIGLLRDNDRVFALKSRQLGITWAVLAHLLYRGMTGGNRLFLVASQSGSDAIDALHRLRILYNSIPNPSVGLVTDNTEQIALANGSRFESMMATKRAGRGKAAYATFCDEMAFWSYPEEQFTALDSASQRLYAATTGNGPGDMASTIWAQSQEGLGRFRSVFYPWSAHPDRDDEWYRVNVTESPNPSLAQREAASTPEDAFRAPEGAWFKRFSRDNNVREFDVVPGWTTDTCVDWGLTGPAALMLQVSPSGQPFVFDEYMPTDEPKTSEFGHGILAKLEPYRIAGPVNGPYADPAGSGRNTQTRRSEFEVFRDLGFHPVGVRSKVQDGCVYMLESIGDPDPDSCLIVHPRCVGLIRALTNVKPHRNDPNIYNTDDPVFSHPLDALRYWYVCRYRKRKRGTFSSPSHNHTARSTDF